MACKLNAEIIAQHFVIAALWADAEEGTNPRPSKAMQNDSLEYAKEFLQKLTPEMITAFEQAEDNGYASHPDCDGFVEGAIGHDLWLTMRRHGVGFWDRDALDFPLENGEAFGEAFGDALTKVAKTMGEPYLYQSRGWAYLD